MPKSYTFRQLQKKLAKHDQRFEFWANRGKGSHVVVYHPDIHGRAASIPIPVHGRKAVISVGIISALVRRFNLPKGVL